MTWKFSRRNSCSRLCARGEPAWDRKLAPSPCARPRSPRRETPRQSPAPRFRLARALRATLRACTWWAPAGNKATVKRNIFFGFVLIENGNGKNLDIAEQRSFIYSVWASIPLNDHNFLSKRSSVSKFSKKTHRYHFNTFVHARLRFQNPGQL